MPIRARNAALIVVLVASTASAALDETAAKRAFDYFDRNCRRDQAQLWGISLCGPIVIVDKGTREAIANDGWSGKLPDDIGIANTAFDWRGKRASMVIAPLPKDDGARDRLLLHERFHAIQDRIGLPMSPPGANEHLDTLEGRSLMRLEMRALRAALIATSRKDERAAFADALAFRRARFEKFPNAALSEAALDRNEGMAEYTAVHLFVDRTDATMLDVAAKALLAADKSQSFERSYAYATGPAWGLLLDSAVPDWRTQIVKGKSFEDLAAGFSPPKVSAASAAKRYGGATILAEEKKRDEDRKARVASYVSRFIEGQTLTLPLHNMNMQMDPYDVHPFPGHGTVYEHITVSDDWGKIAVSKGALISDDFKTLTVFTSPAGVTESEPPWTITLAAGWRLASGARPGDLVAQRFAQ